MSDKDLQLSASPAPLRVVCFGDSITGSCPREAYRHSYLKYSDLLQLMLEAHNGSRLVEVLNRGSAGQTSSQARARLHSDIQDETPDIVVILIGGNDASQPEIASAQTGENLHAIYSSALDAGIRVLALQYHFLPGDDRTKAWHWLTENNGLIADVAGDLCIPTLDMNSLFQQAALTTPRVELVDSEDGVHLRPGGEMVYARAIFARLRGLGWLSSAV